MTTFLICLVLYLVWTILAIIWFIINLGKKYRTKSKWYDYIFYVPMFPILLIIAFIGNMKKKEF